MGSIFSAIVFTLGNGIAFNVVLPIVALIMSFIGIM